MPPVVTNNRTIWSWAFYDWANSAFATTILATFFPIFFKDYCCSQLSGAESTQRLSLANSIGSVVVLMLAPLLGALADRGRSKKKFLATFTLLGIITTAGLYFVQPEYSLYVPLALFVLGVIGFNASMIFYDALLRDIAPPDKIDMISALGYAMGYLGGGLLFALNVYMINSPASFGLPDATAAVKWSFVSVALWWLIFSLPLLFWVKEPAAAITTTRSFSLSASLRQLLTTFNEMRRHKNLFLFLLGYWCYIDGVDTIARLAVDYGKNIGLANKDLIMALLITQFVGFPAAIAYGKLGSRIGPRKAILLGIAVYLGVTIFGSMIKTRHDFYILAITVGLVQGGIQALSRSYFARLIPAGKSAEYFGFYNMLGKFAAVLGPVLMGQTGIILKHAGLSDSLSARFSIISVGILFIVGGILVLLVKDAPQSPHPNETA